MFIASAIFQKNMSNKTALCQVVKKSWHSIAYIAILKQSLSLRIPDSYDAKIAKICHLWTLLPVIQLNDHIYRPERPNIVFFCNFCNITIRYP